MDILDEIDVSINEKKREWNYTPMREKSETDALIDELLKEFSSESKPGQPYKSISDRNTSFDNKPETYERVQYETADRVPSDGVGKKVMRQPDETKMFSTKEIEKYQRQAEQEAEKNRQQIEMQQGRQYSGEEENNDQQQYQKQDTPEYAGNNADNAGNGNGYDGYDDDGYFDDDYYDENDFSRELEDIDRDKLGADENDEFEQYIGGDEDERISIIQPKKKKSIPKIIFRIFYTAVIAAFTIIGIFSSVIYILEQIEMMPSDKEKQEEQLKEEVADALYPFVMTNIDDFDSLDKISDEQLVNLGIWEIVVHGSLKVFEDAETGDIVIPHQQVEYANEKLLGYEKNIEPCNITYAGIDIKYDKEKEGYILPKEHDIYTLYPDITSVSEEDGIYTVHTSCMTDQPHWYSNKKQMPAKNMVFTLEKLSNHYKILSASTVK